MVETWTEVGAVVACGWQELVAAAIGEPPATGVVIGATSIAQAAPPEGFELVRAYVRTSDDTPELRTSLRERLATLARTSGVEELEGLELAFRPLPHEDWAESWKKIWRPFRCGRIAVVPPWWEGELRTDDLRLTLEPGSAFGSGRHATTRTVLRLMQARMRGGERVLDAGCGSGILSAAALVLGAEQAIGFDIDPSSKPEAEDLVRANEVHTRARFEVRDFGLLRELEGSFDVILANIYSDVLQAGAGRLAARLEPGGWLAFSGCPPRHADATRAAITAAGLDIDQEAVRGRWFTFAGHRASRARDLV